ncbi:MAG: acetyl-CoA C-acetyltransferase [Pseudomonadota bacterium]
MAEAYIVDHCRTPRGIGKVGKGALADMHPQHLGAAVLSALRDRNDLDTSKVDDIVWGTSNQTGRQGGDLGRMSALDAGYDVRASGVTLDRFCGSGLTVAMLGASTIMAGWQDVVISGGCEMMSYSFSPEGRRKGGLDAGNMRLRERHPQVAQGVCADAIATLAGISRRATEELAVESQRRADRAIREGRFDRSLVSVTRADGTPALDREEFPRPQTTLETLADLKPSFEAMMDMPLDETGATHGELIARAYPDLEIQHVHHAGNSSGVVDGAAALLVASKQACEANGWTPRAKITHAVNVGDSPELMLNGPVPAARKALERAGLTPDDIDIWEVNEAFAVVAEKFIRDMNLDRDNVNVNGGAIALGHPIGATGAILLGTLIDELERQDKRRGLVTMCAAGGMAPALIVERV